MICVSGKCIKCNQRIAAGNAPAMNYGEVVFVFSDSSKMHVGICSECELTPEEYPEVTNALREAFAMQGFNLKPEIASVERRLTIKDVLMEVQAGRCPVCLESIGDSWIVSNGRLRHEACENQVLRANETIGQVELRVAKPRNAQGKR